MGSGSSRNWLVLYAIALHLGWAALLVGSSEPLRTTPMGNWPWPSSPLLASAWYASVAALAIRAHFVRDRFRRLCFLIPQQGALMLSAFTAFECIFESHYFDGVIRPRAFILADQMPSLLAMILHTGAIIDWTWGRR